MSPRPSPLRLRLVALALLLTLLGLGAELAGARWGEAVAPLVGFLSLSYERNLPTWYASGLLLCCALALFAHARAALTQRSRWRGLGAAFVYLSLDEAVGLHEHLGVLELHGVLYFSWVVPAAVAVALLGLAFLPLLRAMPERLRAQALLAGALYVRAQALLAGALYVGGALVMELPLGWWTERHGDANLTYALIDHVEELLELLGAGLFLAALLEHLPGRAGAEAPAHG